MRIVYGIDEGLKVLSREAFFDDQASTKEVKDGIANIFGRPLSVHEVVSEILSELSRNGDKALRHYTKIIDGIEIDDFEINVDNIDIAVKSVDDSIINALSEAYVRVRDFYVSTLPEPWFDNAKGYGEVMRPIERVGIYIPGGRASYPSTVLMTAIPARVAGVKEIFLATPSQGDKGPNPTVLAAASIVGVDKIFNIGGAQAIGAFAYGTDTIPKVDMICGPGNIFVTIAKKMVYGMVNIDGLAGPTETLIIADETANPVLCAADLLGQAEHDILATPVLVTTEENLIPAIENQIKEQIDKLTNKSTAKLSIERRGVIVVVKNVEDAIHLANSYAPEHLCLMIKEPRSVLDSVKNAGAIFLGENSPEVMGDYIAGPSHVMPTGGTARFNSYLGVTQFIRRSPVVELDGRVSPNLYKTASILSRAEGFDAHARSVELRLESDV